MTKKKCILFVLSIIILMPVACATVHADSSDLKKSDKPALRQGKPQMAAVTIRLSERSQIEVTFNNTEAGSQSSRVYGTILLLVTDGEVPISKFYFLPCGEKLMLDPARKYWFKAVCAYGETYTVCEKTQDGKILPKTAETRYAIDSPVWLDIKIGNPSGKCGEIPDIYFADDKRIMHAARH